jgi:diguanylate cyclase (GGDEF)-like protein
LPFEPHVAIGVLSVALALSFFLLVRLGQVHWERLKLQLHHDALTDLPNRSGLEEELAKILPAALAKNQTLALMFISLDGFRQVNDLYGHRAGDAFLKQIAVRIRVRLKRGDLLARVGGDEFAVVLRDAETQEAVAASILEAVRGCSNLCSHHIAITASVGVSLFPEHGKDALTLLRLADLAMRHSKENAGDRCTPWEAGMTATDFRTGEIVAMIRSALDDSRLHVVYQPVIDREGRIAEMEALVRIHDFLLGSIPPDEFMDVAEQTGLIHELGAWIFRAVCGQAKVWNRAGYRGSVTVNVSPAQLEASDFAAQVLGYLEEAAVPPSSLVIEITEKGMLREPARVGATLRELRDAGVRISLDDFGAEHATLSHLGEFPVDSIKVHGSWTVRLPGDAQARQMVSEAVGNAHRRGYKAIVEGIEESTQLQEARDMGFDLFQGYFVAPPLEAEDATQVLACDTNPLVGMVQAGKQER